MLETLSMVLLYLISTDRYANFKCRNVKSQLSEMAVAYESFFKPQYCVRPARGWNCRVGHSASRMERVVA